MHCLNLPSCRWQAGHGLFFYFFLSLLIFILMPKPLAQTSFSRETTDVGECLRGAHPHLLLLPVYSQSACSSQWHPRQQTRCCLANGALIALLASLPVGLQPALPPGSTLCHCFVSAWLLWTPRPAGCLSAVGDGNGLVFPALLHHFLTCSEIWSRSQETLCFPPAFAVLRAGKGSFWLGLGMCLTFFLRTT